MNAVFDERQFTGKWTGFFLQPDSRRRHRMSLELSFRAGQMAGQGEDDVGMYSVQGRYDRAAQEFSWIKQYDGQHAVLYRGARFAGSIVGEWAIPNVWSGPFFLWAESFGDLESNFERLFIIQQWAGSMGDANSWRSSLA